jgi:hypothetical protein
MMTRSFAFLLVLVFSIGPITVSAQDTYIQCPTQSLETDVTTRLPDGWWSTAQAGNLADTEIVNIGGAPKLLCIYNLIGTEVSIMREAPSGMECGASGSGFKCQHGAQQGGSNSKTIGVSGQSQTDAPVKDQGGKTMTPGNVKADVPVKEQERKTMTPGNVKADAKTQVRSKGDCPDLSLNGVEVKMLSRDAHGQYFFRLAATVENTGRGDFISSAGQQVVEVDRAAPGGPSVRVENISFGSIPAGSPGLEATHDVLRWRTSQEFPPSYRFHIRFDPDITSDGNLSNDDCTVKNNSTSITGEDINDIIRGSGL